MDENNFRQRSRKVAEQAITSLDLLVAFAEGIEQLIDGPREVCELGMIGKTQTMPNRCVAGNRNGLFTEYPNVVDDSLLREKSDHRSHGK